MEFEVGTRVQFGQRSSQESCCPLFVISNLRFSKILRLEIFICIMT